MNQINQNKSCTTCKYAHYSMKHNPCKDCMAIDEKLDTNIKPNWEPVRLKNGKRILSETPITDEKNTVMIKSIIDETMEKKDRSVSIYIHDGSIGITVTPLGADEPRWIRKEDHWECSCCGSLSDCPTRYCPSCGEALKFVNEEVKTDE